MYDILCIYNIKQLTIPSAPTYPNMGYISPLDYTLQNVNYLSN